MYVLRGRPTTIDADREVSRRLLSLASAGEPAVHVWRPHRQVAFGRRDRRLEGYDLAHDRAREHGFPPVERDVGGRAVAYDGTTTLAFARAEPVADFRRGTDERYDRIASALERALESLPGDLQPVRDEPDASFCPGTHSLSLATADGHPRKVAGVAQRVRQDAAVVAGILLVDGRAELAGVLEPVYEALDVPFDPETVGTVADAGGPAAPSVVRGSLEAALVGDDRDDLTIESIAETGGLAGIDGD